MGIPAYAVHAQEDMEGDLGFQDQETMIMMLVKEELSNGKGQNQREKTPALPGALNA